MALVLLRYKYSDRLAVKCNLSSSSQHNLLVSVSEYISLHLPMSVQTLTRFRHSRKFYFPLFAHASTRRNFITLPGTEAQTLEANRILPYKASSIYSLIADVDSYSDFVPYCVDSKVTKWSALDGSGKCWPSEADLKVGWGGYEETFTSRLFCVPNATVEALSGEASSSLPASNLSHYSATLGCPNPRTSNNIFKSLSTIWKVIPLNDKPGIKQHQTDQTPLAEYQTKVQLTIEFQFANPIYAALSKAAAPRVASIMIEAFEVQARKQLGIAGSHRNIASNCTPHSTYGAKL